MFELKWECLQSLCSWKPQCWKQFYSNVLILIALKIRSCGVVWSYDWCLEMWLDDCLPTHHLQLGGKPSYPEWVIWACHTLQHGWQTDYLEGSAVLSHGWQWCHSSKQWYRQTGISHQKGQPKKRLPASHQEAHWWYFRVRKLNSVFIWIWYSLIYMY